MEAVQGWKAAAAQRIEGRPHRRGASLCFRVKTAVRTTRAGATRPVLIGRRFNSAVLVNRWRRRPTCSTTTSCVLSGRGNSAPSAQCGMPGERTLFHRGAARTRYFKENRIRGTAPGGPSDVKYRIPCVPRWVPASLPGPTPPGGRTAPPRGCANPGPPPPVGCRLRG